MFSPTFKGLGTRFALIGALMALMLGVGASTAFASIELEPEPPYEIGVTTPVEAWGESPFPEADAVAVAECNITGLNPESPTPEEEEEMGRLCRFASSEGFVGVGGGEWEANVFVRANFPNFDFIAFEPVIGPESECTLLNEDDCAVVASYYDMTGGVNWIGAEARPIFFE